MDEKLIHLYTQIIYWKVNEISLSNEEISTIYSSAEVIPALFSIMKNHKQSKDIRTLAACGIKRTIINISDNLAESDVEILKAELMVLFRGESDFGILHILSDAIIPLLTKWPEIFNVLHSLIEINSVESIHLMMLLSSRIIEQIPQFVDNSFIETCISLITLSFTQKTNRKAALELFSSIDGFKPQIGNANPAWKKFLEYYHEFLLIDDSECFNIAQYLSKSIDCLEKPDLISILQYFITIFQNDRISNRNKASVFLIIDSILKKQIFPEFYEVFLQFALQFSSSLFDEFCYNENEASNVSFNFLIYYNKLENFEDIILQNIKTDSSNNIFSSLLAILVIFPYVSKHKLLFYDYIFKCCEAPIHSISELAFSILSDCGDVQNIPNKFLDNFVSLIGKMCQISCNHIKQLEIILNYLAIVLFQINFDAQYIDLVISMLISLYQTESTITIHDKIFMCFAGCINSFGEYAKTYLSKIVPILIENIQSHNTQCPLSQPAAVETLAFCISIFPDCFNDIIQPFISLLQSWIGSVENNVICINNNRTNIKSAIDSLIRIVHLIQKEEDIYQIILFIIHYITLNDMSIDDSGIKIQSIQKDCLILLRKLIETSLFASTLLSMIVNSLCRSFINNSLCVKQKIITIIKICSRYHNFIQEFCNFFIDLLNSPDYFLINISLIFFNNLFQLINIQYPDGLIDMINSKCIDLMKNENFSSMKLLLTTSANFDNFPLDIFIGCINEIKEKLSPIEKSEVIGIFCNSINRITLTDHNDDFVKYIMEFSLTCLQNCLNFSIPPTPIRIFSTFLTLIDLNNEFISQFYPIFSQILQSSHHESEYYNDTIGETILFILKLLSIPSIEIPIDIFLPLVFQKIPFDFDFPKINDILILIAKLPTCPLFIKIAQFHPLLFRCLIKIVSLEEKEKDYMGIDNRSFLSIIKLAYDISRSNSQSKEIIQEILGNDEKKLSLIQNRFNNIAKQNVHQSIIYN
ncbi:hypothetical protein TRFO_23410 [Tritrichomonas foetus]|uniref:Importin N-terminal domain-containing protein n=1 Tax=Tritrichomonas foetus TaxID=1144522 RepID=A0A1J4KB52_9EUKA|nr:hypothetical protein TRFO_23410 [Tritrichomonas foetus]|eukprot:OHT08136.1 hypothetical protein TRFO_23410 [Tritrichomonas foetus]